LKAKEKNPGKGEENRDPVENATKFAMGGPGPRGERFGGGTHPRKPKKSDVVTQSAGGG